MKRDKNRLAISFILLIILVIGIGYAYLTSNLSISGQTEIADNTWDIHFENVQINSDSVPIGTGYSAAEVNPSDNTEVTYSILLNRPGDFYEFTVDVKNYGTLDGEIESIISTLKINNNEPIVIASDKSNLPTYLDYSLTYVDGSEILPNHELKVGEKETYKVRIEYKKDISESDLPNTNKLLTFGLRSMFVQLRKSPSPTPSNAIYTLSYSDYREIPEYEEAYTQIGQPIPNEVSIFNNTTDVMNAWTSRTYDNRIRHFYLKHELNSNNEIEASYIEFVVNDELKERWNEEYCSPEGCMDFINNLTNGVYIIRGGVDESNLSEQPIYEENMNTLRTIFSNISCNAPGSCYEPGLKVVVEPNGLIEVRDVDDYCYQFYNCSIDSDGFSTCSYGEGC